MALPGSGPPPPAAGWDRRTCQQRPGANRRAQVELIAARRQQDERRAACSCKRPSPPRRPARADPGQQHGLGLAGKHLPQRLGHSVHLHNGSPGSRCRTPQVLSQAGIIANQENPSLLRIGWPGPWQPADKTIVPFMPPGTQEESEILRVFITSLWLCCLQLPFRSGILRGSVPNAPAAARVARWFSACPPGGSSALGFAAPGSSPPSTRRPGGCSRSASAWKSGPGTSSSASTRKAGLTSCCHSRVTRAEAIATRSCSL